jgi:type I restriction enzyme S subunit
VTWKNTTLGLVCELYQPQTLAINELNQSGLYKVYGANGVIGLHTQYNHAESQVLVTCRGATCGTVNVSEPYAWINGNAMVVKPKHNDIDLKFLAQYLKHLDMSQVITGAAQPQITRLSLSPLKISLPPLAEQKRIADILDLAEEIRRKREQAIEKLDQLAQSTFIEMFGDRKANPKRFTVKRLNEITTISSGSTPSRSTNGYMNGTVPWVKTAEVDGLEIHDTEEKLTEDGLSSIGNKLNPIDSIVVAMYGQGKTRGRVGLLKTIAATNQACGVIKPDKSFLPNFMFWQLHLAYADLRALGRGGNQENLNLQLLGNFEVLLPHLNEQEIYSNFIKCLLRQKNKMQFFNDNLSSLSKSLQHQAFSTGFNA